MATAKRKRISWPERYQALCDATMSNGKRLHDCTLLDAEKFTDEDMRMVRRWEKTRAEMLKAEAKRLGRKPTDPVPVLH